LSGDGESARRDVSPGRSSWLAALGALATISSCTLFNPLGYLQSSRQDGGASCTASPDATHLSGIVALSAHGSHTCAIQSGGAVYCWGSNEEGETGEDTSLDDDRTPIPFRVQLPSDLAATALATGDEHSCALLSNHSVYCWGLGAYGQIGPTAPYSVFSEQPTPQRMTESEGGPPFVAGDVVTAGADFSCAIDGNGDVACWGFDDFGEVGVDPNDSGGETNTPGSVAGTTGAELITAGAHHACAALSDAGVCWGSDTANALGTKVATECGASSCTWVSAVVSTPDTVVWPAISLSAGDQHTCLVDRSSAVYCWGDYSAGQTGDTLFDDIGTAPDAPHRLLGAGATTLTATAVAAGGRTTCLLTSSGDVQCFGANLDGQLGLPPDTADDAGNAPPHTSPEAIAGLADATAIAVGGDHVCAIASCGQVYCWGANDSGQLGNATTSDTPSLVPVEVSAPHP